jgi:hypothetical protein
MLTKMGVSDPSGLVANYQGTEISRTVTEVNGGAKIRADIHYSSGNVDLSPDTTAPTADAGSTGTSATEGSSHTLDASASTDNTEITTYEWDVDGDGTYEASTSSATTSHTYASSGDRTATLRVTDTNGNTATDSVTISVESASGGGDSGTDSTTRWTASGARISVTTSDGTADVTVESPTSNEPIPISVSGADTEHGISLDGLTLSVTTDRTFTLSTATGADVPSGATELGTASTGSAPALGYIQVDHGVPDSRIDGVTFDFRVSDRRLADRGIAPEDVRLYRHHGGSWIPLETRHTGIENGVHSFVTTSPGLSTFAIGTAPPAPDIAVTDATVSTESATVGDAVGITATVENAGDTEGSTGLKLFVNGSEVAERSVVLDAGETRRLSFERSFSTAGEYTVRVGDADAGSLTVESVTPTPEPTSTPTVTATPESTVTSTSSGGSQGTDGGSTTTSGRGPGFGAVAGALALLAAGVLVARRRSR